MTLQFFDSGNISTSLPWVKDYLIENPKEHGKIHSIREFTLVSSGKGYLVTLDKFQIFLWKNSRVTKQVIDALEYYVEQQDGYELVVKLDNSHKESYRLAVNPDKKISWFGTQKKFTTTEFLLDSDVVSTNPFLLPVQVPPTGISANQNPQITPGQNSKKPLKDS